MPAFLSSDQLRELDNKKAIFELDVRGFGLVSVDENIVCGHCTKPGHVTMPEDVTGCMYCQRIEGKALDYDQLESFREVLRNVPEMLRQAKEYYHNRFGSKIQGRKR